MNCCVIHRRDLREDSCSDILISGMVARNRAVHGDLVVVEMLPKSQWQSRSNMIHEPSGMIYMYLNVGNEGFFIVV